MRKQQCQQLRLMLTAVCGNTSLQLVVTIGSLFSDHFRTPEVWQSEVGLVLGRKCIYAVIASCSQQHLLR